MQIDPNIIPFPLHNFPSWLSCQKYVLFACDESVGSQTRVREPDRILIIEDDLLIAAQVESALTEAGFNVMGIATTGEEAITVAGKGPPDFAVVDIRLAGDRDGVDTALELFRSHGIRSIFASAYSDHEARQRAGPASPLGWLQKPYSMASLIQLWRGRLQTSCAAKVVDRRRHISVAKCDGERPVMLVFHVTDCGV